MMPPVSGKKYGPRKGSRPYILLGLKPGESHIFECPEGKSVAVLMQQMGVDISRNGLSGLIEQSYIVGVDMKSDKAVKLVRVTRTIGENNVNA